MQRRVEPPRCVEDDQTIEFVLIVSLGVLGPCAGRCHYEIRKSFDDALDESCPSAG